MAIKKDGATPLPTPQNDVGTIKTLSPWNALLHVARYGTPEEKASFNLDDCECPMSTKELSNIYNKNRSPDFTRRLAKKAQEIKKLKHAKATQTSPSSRVKRRLLYEELRDILHRFKTILDIDVAAFLSPAIPDPDDESDPIITNSRTAEVAAHKMGPRSSFSDHCQDTRSNTHGRTQEADDNFQMHSCLPRRKDTYAMMNLLKDLCYEQIGIDYKSFPFASLHRVAFDDGSVIYEHVNGTYQMSGFDFMTPRGLPPTEMNENQLAMLHAAITRGKIRFSTHFEERYAEEREKLQDDIVRHIRSLFC
ncbi:hypothetical protein BCR43DRAFT_482565 [Syncephalastrum racemosum]|uniref:Uncharacterized protein n=1 Tax=Syncephalastrum racemosum TaxID=13706 RepID=A0A1X2HTW2_SYNRA|nr:hypothetical protein BCR43DRAFT_482565 [Syncephalastrum racemosum]